MHSASIESLTNGIDDHLKKFLIYPFLDFPLLKGFFCGSLLENCWKFPAMSTCPLRRSFQ